MQQQLKDQETGKIIKNIDEYIDQELQKDQKRDSDDEDLDEEEEKILRDIRESRLMDMKN